MVISFTNTTAREQLLDHGMVHTFRLNRRKRTGKDWANKGRTLKKMADVYIEEVGEFMIGALREYVPTSGFGSLAAWHQAIQDENRRRHRSIPITTRGWLYKVTLREDPA